MKLSRISLSAVFSLFVFAANLQATRLHEVEEPFQAGIVNPSSGALPFWAVAICLSLGAVLGWTLLSFSAVLMTQQEVKKSTRQ